jgi:Transglycosylase SLT domain
MPVLRPFINPTLGFAPPAVLQPRVRRGMNNPDFFSGMFQGNQQLVQPMAQQTQQAAQPQQSQQMGGGQQQQFEQTNATAPYLEQQLQNYANRAQPPSLEPGGRVRSANMELVQPSNFKALYEQLAGIGQQAVEQVGAASARAAFKRMQELAELRNQQVPAFTGPGGIPIGYKNPAFERMYTGSAGAAGSGIGLPGRAGSGLFGGSTPALSGSRGQAQSIMQRMARQWGWGNQWGALYRLIMKESGFNPSAANPTSSARGLFQKMTSIHGPLERTIEGQILWGFNYIRQRYGNPTNALNFHLRNNWY